jgi:hypothetical protein
MSVLDGLIGDDGVLTLVWARPEKEETDVHLELPVETFEEIKSQDTKANPASEDGSDEKVTGVSLGQQQVDFLAGCYSLEPILENLVRDHVQWLTANEGAPNENPVEE